MEIELKPCPFCGGDAQIEHHELHSHGFQTADFKMPDHPGSWTILCTGCSCGMIDETQEQIVAAWNRRASQAIIEQIKSLPSRYGSEDGLLDRDSVLKLLGAL